MPTIRLVVRYDGTVLSGWQRQRGVKTVQAELERAAGAMAHHVVRVHGAGRTDAGVHALGQVASFKTTAIIPERGWQNGMNSTLPFEISVSDARQVSDDFDPRRASAGKRYRYLIYNSRSRHPLLHHRTWLIHDALDMERLNAATEMLAGTHDFGAFRAADCERTTTDRTLFKVRVREQYMNIDGLLAVEVEGTAFLKNMVRIIVGTVVDIARGRLELDCIDRMFETRRRSDGGITAPACGLYLDEVFIRPEFRLDDDVLSLRPPYADAMLELAAAAKLTEIESDE